MRRITMFNRVTADGCFAGKDGNLDWVVPEEEIDNQGANATARTDTVLFGRRTYEMMAAFWPHAESDPHGGRKLSPAMRAMAKFLNEAKKLVFSRTLKEVTWKNSRLLREIDPRAIEAMKKQPGKDMIILGSGSIVSQLTVHGLIDQYDLAVTPVFLGDGRPLMSGVSLTSKLDLLEAKKFPSGNVWLRYAPKK